MWRRRGETIYYLSEEAWNATWAEGRATSVEEAIAYALEKGLE